MFRRLFAAGLALPLLGACGESPPDRPPNVLLVTVDTLRADRLACYRGPPDAGRHICSLANAGARFEWAFSAAPYTAPSVASILTGRYPAFHTVRQSALSYLRNEAVTVAERFEAAGYTTAAFISNPVLDRSRNLGQGFSVYDQHMTRAERNRPTYAERDAAATTDAALAWAQVAAEPPWFLWVHYQDPHGPYDPPGAPPEHDDSGADALPVLEHHSGRGGIPAYQALPGLRSAGAYARRYLAEIRFLDPQVKRLVDGLDALGSPPAVLLTSDHGEAFGEDGYYFAHGHSLGLDQIRVPLLWRPARPAARTVVQTPVSLVDVAPTLLAAAGLALPEDFQGRPLPGIALPGVDPDANERPVFAEHARQVAVIAHGTYYARNRREPTEEEERDRVSGGRALWLPPRSATLGTSDAPLPPYSPAEPGSPAWDALEPAIRSFLEVGGERPEALRKEISPELRERLRALGYLD